jgi:hypothetical protein
VIYKQKLCSIALVSTAMILLMVNIIGAAPFAFIVGGGTGPSWAGSLSAIDTASDTVTNTVTGTATDPLNKPYGIAVWTSSDPGKKRTKVCVASPNEPGVTTPDGTQQSIYIYDTANNQNPITVPGISTPYAVAFSPEGTKVYYN